MPSSMIATSARSPLAERLPGHACIGIGDIDEWDRARSRSESMADSPRPTRRSDPQQCLDRALRARDRYHRCQARLHFEIGDIGRFPGGSDTRTSSGRNVDAAASGLPGWGSGDRAPPVRCRSTAVHRRFSNCCARGS